MFITLRSGKELGDSKEVESEKMETEKEDARVEKKEEKKKKSTSLLWEGFCFSKIPPKLPHLYHFHRDSKGQFRWAI